MASFLSNEHVFSYGDRQVTLRSKDKLTPTQWNAREAQKRIKLQQQKGKSPQGRRVLAAG